MVSSWFSSLWFDVCVSISATSFFHRSWAVVIIFAHHTLTFHDCRFVDCDFFSCYLPLFCFTWTVTTHFCFPLIFFVHLGYIYYFLPSNMLLVDTLFSFSLFLHASLVWLLLFLLLLLGVWIFGLRVGRIVASLCHADNYIRSHSICQTTLIIARTILICYSFSSLFCRCYCCRQWLLDCCGRGRTFTFCRKVHF